MGLFLETIHSATFYLGKVCIKRRSEFFEQQVFCGGGSFVEAFGKLFDRTLDLFPSTNQFPLRCAWISPKIKNSLIRRLLSSISIGDFLSNVFLWLCRLSPSTINYNFLLVVSSLASAFLGVTLVSLLFIARSVADSSSQLHSFIFIYHNCVC